MKKNLLFLSLGILIFTNACVQQNIRKQEASNLKESIHKNLYSLIDKTHKDKGMFKGLFPEEEEIISYGDPSIPILIDYVKDTIPFKWKVFGFTPTVGDYAYFTLCRLKKVDIPRFLPEDIQEEYQKIGIGAYYQYINTNQNRDKLFERLRKEFR